MRRAGLIVLFYLITIPLHSFSLQKEKLSTEMQEAIVLEFVNKDLQPKDKLVILESVPGNYTGAGNDELLVFFDTKRNADLYVQGVGAVVKKAMVFVIEKSKVTASYLLDCDTMAYDEKNGIEALYSDILKVPVLSLGKICNNGWIGDFNGTGKDQICLYMGSIWEYPVIYEFFNDEFKIVLPPSDYFCYIISADKKTKSIKLQKYHGDSYSIIVATWDNGKQEYEQKIVAQ